MTSCRYVKVKGGLYPLLSELKSRSPLMHEQCNPWKQLHLQDGPIQHRGRKHHHRYGLLDDITLLSLALLSL